MKLSVPNILVGGDRRIRKRTSFLRSADRNFHHHAPVRSVYRLCPFFLNATMSVLLTPSVTSHGSLSLERYDKTPH